MLWACWLLTVCVGKSPQRSTCWLFCQPNGSVMMEASSEPWLGSCGIRVNSSDSYRLFFHLSERFCVSSSASLQSVHRWSHTAGQRQVVCGAAKVTRGNNSLLNDTVHLLFLCIQSTRGICSKHTGHPLSLSEDLSV